MNKKSAETYAISDLCPVCLQEYGWCSHHFGDIFVFAHQARHWAGVMYRRSLKLEDEAAGAQLDALFEALNRDVEMAKLERKLAIATKALEEIRHGGVGIGVEESEKLYRRIASNALDKMNLKGLA